MESDQELTILPANNDFFKHMFIGFLCTKTTAQALHVKFEHTLDSKVFSGKEFSIKQVHECLESFMIILNLKITLSLDCILMPETHIAYTFSHTSSTAQEYIAPKIQAKHYQD